MKNCNMVTALDPESAIELMEIYQARCVVIKSKNEVPEPSIMKNKQDSHPKPNYQTPTTFPVP